MMGEATVDTDHLIERTGRGDEEILILRHFEQKGTAEVAVALGLNTGAVRNRHDRAILGLREQEP